jgi:hypothetical protein
MDKKIDAPSSKDFVHGSASAFDFPSAPKNHIIAKGIFAAALWRLLRK